MLVWVYLKTGDGETSSPQSRQPLDYGLPILKAQATILGTSEQLVKAITNTEYRAQWDLSLGVYQQKNGVAQYFNSTKPNLTFHIGLLDPKDKSSTVLIEELHNGVPTRHYELTPLKLDQSSLLRLTVYSTLDKQFDKTLFGNEATRFSLLKDIASLAFQPR
jgi:hypothetical protein